MKNKLTEYGKVNNISDMKKALIFPLPLLFSILLVFGASETLGQYKKGSVEDKLIQLDKAWTFAELKGDKKAAAEFMADDYVGTTQQGVLENKTQYLATLAPNADAVRSDEYNVRIFGNTAIMTHRGTVEGVRNMKFRSTHVWMKRGGKWLIVAHHGSPMIPPSEDAEPESQ